LAEGHLAHAAGEGFQHLLPGSQAVLQGRYLQRNYFKIAKKNKTRLSAILRTQFCGFGTTAIRNFGRVVDPDPPRSEIIA
jgi:hypothetical protein